MCEEDKVVVVTSMAGVTSHRNKNAVTWACGCHRQYMNDVICPEHQSSGHPEENPKLEIDLGSVVYHTSKMYLVKLRRKMENKMRYDMKEAKFDYILKFALAMGVEENHE